MHSENTGDHVNIEAKFLIKNPCKFLGDFQSNLREQYRKLIEIHGKNSQTFWPRTIWPAPTTNDLARDCLT